MEQLYCHGNVLPWCRGERPPPRDLGQGATRGSGEGEGVVGFVFSGRKKKFLERIDLNGAGTIQKFLPLRLSASLSLSLRY